LRWEIVTTNGTGPGRFEKETNVITVGDLQLKDLNELRDTWTHTNKKYTSPDGKCSIRLGDDCWLDDDVSLGVNVSLGDGCLLGDDVSLGYDCWLGDYVSLGYGCWLDDDVSLRDGCSLYDDCSLGYGYNLPVSPLWFCGPRHPIGYYLPGMVKSGYVTHPIRWWEKNIERYTKKCKYTQTDTKEYIWRVKALADWMKLWGVYETPKHKA